jgi:predicted transcriptional regulator
MADKKKTKTRYVDLHAGERGFVSKFVGQKKPKAKSDDILLLRQVLSNEKARILNAIKNQKPKSIYGLAKFLGRDFKSVSEDLKLLERFGFIDFHEQKTGKRIAHVPFLDASRMEIIINI